MVPRRFAVQDSIQGLVSQLEARLHEQERVNRELAESHARLRAILDNEPECVKLLAPDGSLLEMNPAGLRMIEADTFEQVRNHSVYPLIVEEHRDAFRALNEKVLAGGSGVLRFEGVGLKGGRRWLETHVSPLRDATGAISATLGITRDISARKRAEQAMSQQLAEIEQLYQTAPIGLALVDRELRFVRINERLAAIDGRPADEHIGRTLDEMVPELSRELRSLYQRVLDTGRPVLDVEITGPNPADPGREGSWLASYLPVHGEDGRVVGVSAVVADVGEQKRARMRLDEAQRIGRIGDWEYEPDTGRVSWSPQVYILHGRDPALGPPGFDEALGYYDPDSRAVAADRLARVMASGQEQQYEMSARLPDGSPVHHAVVAVPVLDDAGRVVRVRGIVQDITQRKQAELLLRRSEAQLRSVMDGLGTHMLVGLMDTDGVLRMVNTPARELASVSEEDVIGRHIADTYPVTYSDEVRNRVREAVRRAALGEVVRYDEQVRVAGDRLLWLDLCVQPLRDETGTIVSVVSSGVVIEERRRAEAARARSERQLRTVMDGLGPHMFVGLMDLDGVVLLANRPARDVASLSEEDVLGLPVEDTYWFAYSGEVRSRIRDAVRRAASGEEVRYDERIRVAEDQCIWIDFSLQPLRDQTGAVVQLVPSAIVIDQRKRAEEALRAREAQLALVYDNIEDVVFVLDVVADGYRFAAVNPRFTDATGLDAVEVVGKRVEDVIPEPSLSIVLRKYAAAVADGRRVQWEDVTPYPAGTRYGEVTVAPILDGEGRCIQLIGTVHDITGRRQAEQQLREAALRQRALSRRLVEVQEAEQRRISAELHDRIGQDLTALGIHLNIIGRSAGDPRAAAARLEDSRILLENTIASLRGLIAELRPPVLEDYGLLAGLRWYGGMVASRAGLGLEVHGSDPDPRPPAHVEAALFRIAQEALVNATKHARASRVDLTLQCAPGRLVLGIADDGIGFDAELLRRSGPRGHWGLEMMRERAEAVGARLEVQSSPGQGTRVVVEFDQPP